MNYAYDRLAGIPLGGDSFLLDFSPLQVPGSSRTTLLPDIDESALNEGEILDPGNLDYRIRYTDDDGDRRSSRADSFLDYSGDNWDGTQRTSQDPPLEAGSSGLINSGWSLACEEQETGEDALTDHNDWANMTLGFRSDGDSADAEIPVSGEMGMADEDDAPQLALEDGRANVAVELSSAETTEGTFEITAVVSTLSDFADLPEVLFEFAGDAELLEPTPRRVLYRGPKHSLPNTRIHSPRRWPHQHNHQRRSN